MVISRTQGAAAQMVKENLTRFKIFPSFRNYYR